VRDKAVLITIAVAVSLAWMPSDQKCCKPGVGGGEFAFSDTQGGFTEEYTDTDVRDQDETNPSTYLPVTRAAFRFPAPYNTDAFRLTLGADAVGQDCHNSGLAATGCIRQTGYSDNWMNIFNQGAPSGDGHDVVEYWNSFGNLGVHKGYVTVSTRTVSPWVKMFENGDPLEDVNSASDSWQTSLNPSEPHTIYVKGGEGHLWEFLRCNTGAGTASLPISSTDGIDCVIVGSVNSLAARTAIAGVAGGAAADYLNDVKIWSPHTDATGTKFSATVKDLSGADVANIWMTAADTWIAKPFGGDPHMDLSGTYGGNGAEALSGCPASSGIDYYIFRLDTPGTEHFICDFQGGSHPSGAPGHLAYGHGFAVFSDNDAAGFEVLKLWDLSDVAGGGDQIFSYTMSIANGFGQPSWNTAVPAGTTAIANQQMCHTNIQSESAPGTPIPRERELVCFRPGDPTVLVVAPQMTDVTADGTGGNEAENFYYKGPKPNISSDGRWYYLVSNHWTGYMDAFLIRIPRTNLPMPGAPAPVSFLERTLPRARAAPVSFLERTLPRARAAPVSFLERTLPRARGQVRQIHSEGGAMTGLKTWWAAFSPKQKWIVGGAVVGLLAWGLYASRLVHGVWYGRSLYVYYYEPNRERIDLANRAKQVQDEIKAFKDREKGK
jgi:hypothetical protein